MRACVRAFLCVREYVGICMEYAGVCEYVGWCCNLVYLVCAVRCSLCCAVCGRCMYSSVVCVVLCGVCCVLCVALCAVCGVCAVWCVSCVLCCVWCVWARSHRILPTSSLFASTLQPLLCSSWSHSTSAAHSWWGALVQFDWTYTGAGVHILVLALVHFTGLERRVGCDPVAGLSSGGDPPGARGTQNALSGSSALSTAPKHLFENMEVFFNTYTLGCPKNTPFLNFASAVESLVRMGVQRPQFFFQHYRPINDTWPLISILGLF